MNRSLELRPLARAEVEDAYEWYEDQRPGLGEEFLSELGRVLEEVERAPLRYQKIRREVRRALLRQFPYAVLYLVEPDVTVVIACFHARRDPRHWHERR